MRIKNERHAVMLSMSVWHYIWFNGLVRKSDYVRYREIKKMYSRCPMCEYINSKNFICQKCFLDYSDSCCGGAYSEWVITGDPAYARIIYDALHDYYEKTWGFK